MDDEDEIKRTILLILKDDGELWISEIHRRLSQRNISSTLPNVSKYLEELQNAGQVELTTKGALKFYHLKPGVANE